MHSRQYRRFALSFSITLALTYVGCSSDSEGGGTAGGGGAGNSSGTGGAGGGTGGSTAGGGSGNTGGGISFGGSGGSNTGGAQGDACASTVVNSDLVPANLLLVIDRSGSMNCNLPSDGQASTQCENFPAPIDTTKPTKWALTKTALEQAIDDMALAGTTSAGMVVFPRPASDCNVTQTPDVPIQPLVVQQVTDLKNFLGGVTPKGKTPLAGATILSYAHLYDLLKSGTLTGNLFVVLLTDGFETCAPGELPKLLTTACDPNAPGSLPCVQTAQLVNIRTFVIGVPGSENGRALLSQIAYEGGTAKTATCTHNATPNDAGDCHFDMTKSANFSADLKAALQQISGTVLSCEVAVPKAPPGKKINANDVKVKVTGTEVPQDNSATCDKANGWQFSADKSKIFLCGSACDDAKKPNAKIELDLGCLQDIR
ncbi:MAG: VWA domain-containing protein [Myxococcales bacterium]|nr:VWA domain-containing protein [Myxococcales bacterium]